MTSFIFDGKHVLMPTFPSIRSGSAVHFFEWVVLSSTSSRGGFRITDRWYELLILGSYSTSDERLVASTHRHLNK
jgi:hypothetical protein